MMVQSPKPRVLIVGAGFAGLAAARALRGANAEIVVIDKTNHHLFQPLLYQVATAALPPETIAAPIRTILSDQSNCRVLMGNVDEVELGSQTVSMDGTRERYDYLLIATGFDTHYFGNDSWAEHAPGLKTLDEAIDVRARFLRAFERSETEEDGMKRKAAITFVIVGAGPTGVELAAALAEIAKSFREDFHSVDTTAARIVLVDMAERVLPAFPRDLSEQAKEYLDDLGVEVLLETRVTLVDEHGITAETSSGSTRIDTGNVVWAAGVSGNALGKTLGAKRDDSGRVFVTRDLSIAGHPNVFVAGDLARHSDPSTDSPVPAVAQGAIQGGRFVGRTIAAEIDARFRGRPTPARGVFEYDDKGSMAIIGRNRAVARLGRRHLRGYLAFLIWAFVHILFLIGFRRKLLVFMEWVRLYFTGGRGARLITREDV